MSGRCYRKLDGMKITMRDGAGNEQHGKITGSDYSIGITAQDDKGNYLMCLNGPLSPVMREERFNHRLHRKMMAYLYDKITKGETITQQSCVKIMREADYFSLGMPDGKFCAFNQ